MKSIFILDDDKDLCEVMGLALTSYGVQHFISYNSLEELKKSEDFMKCEIALLDVNLGTGQPDGLDVYRYLISRKFSGEIFFFTGHGMSDKRVKEIAKISQSKILEKPVRISELVKILGMET